MLRAQPLWLLFATGVLGVALIGWLDFATGWELSLFVFYALPIFVVVWYGNQALGIGLAVFGTLVWWAANAADSPYQTTWGYLIAALSRGTYFIFAAVGAAAVKAHRQADAARIAALERTQELEHEIIAVSEHEQRRIGQDLHDGLCQELAAISFAARSLAEDLQSAAPPLAIEAQDIAQLLGNATVHARDLARGIFPVISHDNGLAAGLEELAALTRRLTTINVTFRQIGAIVSCHAEVAMHVYRICQEALSNAVRHSHGTQVEIILERFHDSIVLYVRDNGSGFDSANIPSGGMGLRTMRYRAQSLGADFSLESQPSIGTTLKCKVQNAQIPRGLPNPPEELPQIVKNPKKTE